MNRVFTGQERELPLASSRTLMFLKIFFTGIVDALPQKIVDKRKENWGKLSPDNATLFLGKVDRRSRGRRSSMFETSSRSNYLGVIDAFAAAAGVALLVAPDTRGASEVLLKIGVSLIFFAACILRMAIGAKGKVWKKPRAQGFSEADEMLEEHIADSTEHDMQLSRDRAFQRLHSRKLVLVAERRAQNFAVYVSNLGTILVIVGLCIR